MNNNPTISVIVPVFKVAHYLDRCIESLVNQNYSNIEIILVDDGSPDDCAIKSDKWAKKDKRIKVIHKLNGGLSDARNFGMSIASGEYISFVDSDDYITDDFLEVLLLTALKHNSDIVECDFTFCYENGIIKKFNDDLAVHDYSATEGLSALIDEKEFHQHVWDKLYKREVIKDIYYEVGKLHEDVFWTYQVFGKAKVITKINRTMYFYFQRESSILGQEYSLRRLDYLEGKWNRQLYIEKKYPELTLKAKLDFFDSCLYIMQCVIKNMSGSEKHQAIAIIRNYKKRCCLNYKDIRSVCSKKKKYYYLAKINMYLCCMLREALGIG